DTLMLPTACGAARSAWASSRPTGQRSRRASSAAPPGSSATPAPPSRRGPPTPSSVGAAPPAAALAHGCPSARACETGQITCQTRADRSLVSNTPPQILARRAWRLAVMGSDRQAAALHIVRIPDEGPIQERRRQRESAGPFATSPTTCPTDLAFRAPPRLDLRSRSAG